MTQTFSLLLQPTRFKIALYLVDSSFPQYTEQIAAKVKEHPRLVLHHLELLESSGFVQSRYNIIYKSHGRGFAARYFSPQPKLLDALQELSDTTSMETHVR
jgi:predicted ArsR family transcriptional regulator